jgi:hypothetical protein
MHKEGAVVTPKVSVQGQAEEVTSLTTPSVTKALENKIHEKVIEQVAETVVSGALPFKS